MKTQPVLPGLEGYVCTFECLTNCPLAPDGGCYYDDPPAWEMWDEVQYPEFFDWQVLNEKLVCPQPENPLQTRCPRCFSIEVITGYLYIECKNCGYNEILSDYAN